MPKSEFSGSAKGGLKGGGVTRGKGSREGTWPEGERGGRMRENASRNPKGYQKRMDGFKMASFLNYKRKTRHFGTRLFRYPFGCLFSSAQRGIITDGFQNGKFLSLENDRFGTRLFWCPFGFLQSFKL